MKSRERFIRKLLHNLNSKNNNNNNNIRGLAMLKKTSSLETFFATAPSHNDLLSKAESSTRNSSRWTRNCGSVSIQTLQQPQQNKERGGGEAKGRADNSVSMAHKRNEKKSRNRNLIYINPVNINAWNVAVQQNPNPIPPSNFIHRCFSNMMVNQQTPSNVYFRRHAERGEFSGGYGNPTPKKSRKYHINKYLSELLSIF